MSLTKDEMRTLQRALEILERAQYGCDLPGSGELSPTGPVSQAYAIGWATGSLRGVLGLPAQPNENQP